MAVVGTAQRGSTTIATVSATTATVTISSIDTTKSFLRFSSRVASTNPVQSHVNGEITNATTLTFAVNATVAAGPTVTIEWEVIPFTSGATVQRGSVAAPGTATAVTISAVTLSQSFPLICLQTSGAGYGTDDSANAEITTTTNLQITMTAGNAGTIKWQVIDYTGCSVQLISATLTAVNPTQTITSVDTTKTLVVSSATVAAAVTAQGLYRVSLTNATTLTYDKVSGTLSWNVKTYVISFTDGTSVQMANASPTGTTQAFTISAVTLAESCVFSGANDNGHQPANIADDNFGETDWAYALSSTTNINATRNASTTAATMGMQVVDFNSSSGAVVKSGRRSLLGVGI